MRCPSAGALLWTWPLPRGRDAQPPPPQSSPSEATEPGAFPARSCRVTGTPGGGVALTWLLRATCPQPPTGNPHVEPSHTPPRMRELVPSPGVSSCLKRPLALTPPSREVAWDARRAPEASVLPTQLPPPRWGGGAGTGEPSPSHGPSGSSARGRRDSPGAGTEFRGHLRGSPVLASLGSRAPGEIRKTGGPAAPE